MGLVILLAIIVIVGLVALLVAIFGDMTKNARLASVIGGVLLIGITPVIFWLSGYQGVPVKSVGVVTSFGKVVGTPYGPGQHWLVPWKSLNIVQDTIQSDSFAQANCPSDSNGNPQPCADVQLPSGTHGYCISVRFAGLNQGCIDVQLQTQVEEKAIPELYGNYSSYGPNLTQDIDQFVVQRELRTELNRVLGDYNVIADVTASLEACTSKGQTGCSPVTSSQFSQFDPVVLTALRSDPQLQGRVDVLDVNLQFPHFSGNVENSIEAIQFKYNEIVQAQLQEQVNARISAANAALVSAKQGQTLTPAVLTYDCLQEVASAIKANYQLPTGFSCGGSSPNLILGK